MTFIPPALIKKRFSCTQIFCLSTVSASVSCLPHSCLRYQYEELKCETSMGNIRYNRYAGISHCSNNCRIAIFCSLEFFVFVRKSVCVNGFERLHILHCFLDNIQGVRKLQKNCSFYCSGLLSIERVCKKS